MLLINLLSFALWGTANINSRAFPKSVVSSPSLVEYFTSSCTTKIHSVADKYVIATARLYKLQLEGPSLVQAVSLWCHWKLTHSWSKKYPMLPLLGYQIMLLVMLLTEKNLKIKLAIILLHKQHQKRWPK